MYLVFVFFFKQKTAYEMRISDWSSDVCSSDLAIVDETQCRVDHFLHVGDVAQHLAAFGAFREKLHPQTQTGKRGAKIVRHRCQQIGRASCRERVCQYV